MHRSLARSLAGCFLVLLTATSTFGLPVELDAPDLLPGIQASSIIHLDVFAGASGAPNGFTIEWMTAADFAALGDWPTDLTNPALHSAIYLGTPTLNTVDGATTFQLGSGASGTVEIGDIFDETGVTSTNRDEIPAGTEYVFRVRANGDGALLKGGAGLYTPSTYSPTHHCHTKPHDDHDECVHSQGYWKNHTSAWPVSSLRLGNIIYSKTQLIAIFGQPASGNGLISLAHQLMATKLNQAAGAILPALISNVIATADALSGTKIVPPIGTGFLAPRVTSHLTDDLEEYNDNEMNHNCQVVTPASHPTWGQLKAMYR